MPLAVTATGMNHARTAPAAGVAACLLTVAAVAAPYLLLPADQAIAIDAYYGLGAVSPLGIGLLGLMGAVIFAAGRQDRSDPSLVAGVMLAIGLFSLFVSVQWALAFRPELFAAVATSRTRAFLADHRWSVVAGTVLMTLAAVWYAAALDLLPLPRALAELT